MGNLGIQNYTKKLYNLDMILAVGYRVKSPNGIVFREWATSILKDYMIKGYAINEKRLKALNRVIEIQSRIIAQNYNIDMLMLYLYLMITIINVLINLTV